MIATIKIEEIQRFTTKKDKDGNEVALSYFSKKANKQMPFTRLKIKGLIEGVSRNVSAADFDGWTKDFKVGDEIVGTLQEKEWNGNKYWDLSPLRKLDQLEARIAKLEKEMASLKSVPGMPTKTDVKEWNVDDLPF